MPITDYHPVRTALIRRYVLSDDAIARQAQFRSSIDMKKLAAFEEMAANMDAEGRSIVDLSGTMANLSLHDDVIDADFTGTVYVHFGETTARCLDNFRSPTGAYVFAHRLASGAISGVVFLVNSDGVWDDVCKIPYYEVLADHGEARLYRYIHRLDGTYFWDIDGEDGPFMSNEQARTLVPLVAHGVTICLGKEHRMIAEAGECHGEVVSVAWANDCRLHFLDEVAL